MTTDTNDSTALATIDDPIEDLAMRGGDPKAGLAAWDIVRDPEFYDGLPPEELERALDGLYAMAASPPDYASPEELASVIDHVEGMLAGGSFHIPD